MLLKILLLFVIGECVMGAPDYGSIPKLIIKDAGPSKTFGWVGYTHHYPSSVPSPLLLYKWHPYMDPTYTAFWVSHKPVVHGGGYGHDHGHVHTEAKIPHGFGAPKPSSIAFHGDGGYSDSIITDHHPGIEAADFSLQGGHGIQISPGVPLNVPSAGYEQPIQAPQNVYAEPELHLPQDNYIAPNPQPLTYNEPAAVAPVQPAISYEQPVVVYEQASVAHEQPLSYQTPVGQHIDVQPLQQNYDTDLQLANIQPAQLVHVNSLNSYSGPGALNNIQPLVALPHSAPLPLENEGGFLQNNLVQGQNYVA